MKKFLFLFAFLAFFAVSNSEAQNTKKKEETKKTNPPKKEEKKEEKKPETTDKAVGKDEKGRTIYQGPKGGKYYLTASGNKVYVK